MDIVKIGKFIAENRKKKNMTQAQLAEKLGVTAKTISRWENGNYMPDISLLKPISEELGITLNDLLSGEKVEKEQYQEKLEENILNTIDYSHKKVNEKNSSIGLLLVVIGILCTITAMSIFPSDSSWGGTYSVFGGIISLIGISKLTHKFKYWKRLVICFTYLIVFMAALVVIDYIGVINIHQAPRFSYLKIYNGQMIEYKAPFYNVYRINNDTKNEYYIVDTEKKYTPDTVPIVPFNRKKSGIDNIIKYKNKYIGNNSNVGNLLNALPLSEYGLVFEIDSENLGLTVDYHITDWYINDNMYVEKALVYNSVSIFSLIDNVQYINYNFTGKSYKIEREKVEKLYPNYNKINENGIIKDNFNIYLESRINDNEFIKEIFNKLLV
ncbi:MAG: helix-turn-helix domain-containing protein [Clostridia bacterium]|nr:helix-turn-helix domain-containing protein [Clostridia bacterium]